jgi:hypothetical protein
LRKFYKFAASGSEPDHETPSELVLEKMVPEAAGKDRATGDRKIWQKNKKHVAEKAKTTPECSMRRSKLTTKMPQRTWKHQWENCRRKHVNGSPELGSN